MATGAASGRLVWDAAREEAGTAGSVRSEDGRDTHFVVVGARRAGKTTILQRFQAKASGAAANGGGGGGGGGDGGARASGAGAAAVKPTTALEYSYARTSTRDRMAKNVAHLWELGGGPRLAGLLEVPLVPATLPRTTAVVVVDLSRPLTVMPTLSFWLDTLRTRLAQCLRDHEDGGLEKKLRSRELKRYGREHPDWSSLRVLGMPLVVLATKFDVFRERDSERRKIVSRALRHAAHVSGGTLVYAMDETMATATGVLTHFAFRGPALKASRTEHAGPIAVAAGTDLLDKIGSPPGSGGGGGDLYQQWQAAIEPLFEHDAGAPEDLRLAARLFGLGGGGDDDDADAGAAAADGEFAEAAVDQASLRGAAEVDALRKAEARQQQRR